MTNLLPNESLEGEYKLGQLWWQGDDDYEHNKVIYGPYKAGLTYFKWPGEERPAYDNIEAPERWAVWWVEGVKNASTPFWDQLTGRPEAHGFNLLASDTDTARVRTGNKAAKIFTFWRNHKCGLVSIVSGITPGTRLRFSAYGHGWYSDCDSKPHAGPLQEDCATPSSDAHMILRAGISPSGGFQPIWQGDVVPNVVWGPDVEQYGGYGPPCVVEAVAESDTVTVWLWSATNFALKHADVYWDDPVLEVIEELPPPREYDRTAVLYGPATTVDKAHALLDQYWQQRRSFTFSADDAMAPCEGVQSRTVICYDADSWPGGRDGLVAFRNTYYPGVELQFPEPPEVEPPPNPSLPPNVGGLWLAYPTTHLPPVITQPFKAGVHGGIDLRSSWAAWGDEILSALPGEVVIASTDEDDTFGYQVLTRTILMDGSRIDCRYAHMLEGVYVHVGDRVDWSTKLGKAGSTGTSTGDHLHFSANVNGTYVDPAPLIEWPDTEPPTPGYTPPPGINQGGGLDTLHLQTFPTPAEMFIRDTHPRIVKGLGGQQDWWGVMRNDSQARFVWRHHGDQHESLHAGTPTQMAAKWISYWIDSLRHECDRIEAQFPGIKWPLILVESWNEVYACGDPFMDQIIPAEAEFLRILHDVEPRAAGVVFTAPVGNPLESEYKKLIPLAKAAAQYGGWFGYHGYWFGNKDQQGMTDAHWPWLQGRWTEIDKVFVTAGYKVRWFLGESGIVGGKSLPGGGYYLNPGSGWKDGTDCIGGDWSRYLAEIVQMRQRITAWNATHDNRCDGFALFTTGDPSYMGWASFQIQGPEMAAIAASM